MSVFNAYTKGKYIEALRQFLRFPEMNFLRNMRLVETKDGKGKRAYLKEGIEQLEVLVNQKAARVESVDTTLGERITLARDYLLMTDTEIGRAFGLTREMVRRWRNGLNVPTDIERLANLLKVPIEWLKSGNPAALPSDSHLGVRVGSEKTRYCAELLELTHKQIGLVQTGESVDDDFIRGFIEMTVFNSPEMSNAARRAGGRWQWSGGELKFAAWKPLPSVRKRKSPWSDEVEDIINDELSKPGQSVSQSYRNMTERWTAMGLSEQEYPTKIALHKRLEKQRAHESIHGVDINDEVSKSIEKYA